MITMLLCILALGLLPLRRRNGGEEGRCCSILHIC